MEPGFEAATQLALTNMVTIYLFSPSRRRLGPMLPQAPEFDRFLRPCPIGEPRAGCTMGPGLRRDGVICSEGAMKANWITASFRRDSESGNCQFFISVWILAQPPSSPTLRSILLVYA